MNVEGAFSFLNQALDNVQPKTGAIIVAFSGEIGLEDFGEDF
jgi:hypothetical protein